MGTISGPFSIPDGLMYHIDPSNPKSYAGYGTIIYDMSGNGNTSYFTNGALYQNYQKGTVLIDGVNDYIAFPLFNLTSPFTISVWAKNIIPDSPIFSGYGGGVTYGNGETIFYYMPDNVTMMICGGSSNNKYFIFPEPKFNNWYNFVLTRDVSNNVKMYRNGIGSTSNAQSYSNTFQINQIGRYSNFTNQYNPKGHLGETRIYNRALSDQEVLQNYNSNKNKYINTENYVTSNLVLNLDFGNPTCYIGTGNTAYDLSGFGHTASLINGAAYSSLYGGNILCDGTNDYIEAVTTSVLDFGTNNFSVEYWYRKTEWTTNFENIWGPNIWSAGDNASTNEWTLGIGQGAVGTPGIGESVAFGLQIPSFGVYATPQIRAPGNLNKFNQIVGIRNGSLIELYYNGSLMYSANPGGGFDSLMQLNNVSNNIRISNSYINQYHSKAHTGILRIYNKALSAREVNQNYQALLPRFSDTSIVTDGLILNYDFGSAETYPGVGTSAQNLVGTGLTGTLTNSPVYSVDGGGSIYFDGSNDYIDLPSNFFKHDSGTPFTITIWFKTTTTGVIFGQQNTSVPSPTISTGFVPAIYVDTNGKLRTSCFWGGSQGNQSVTTVSVNDNIWHNVTVTFESTSHKSYLDGVLFDTISKTQSAYAATYYYFVGGGRNESWANVGNIFFSGNISNFRFYNRALSTQEIAQNFNNMRNRFGI